MRSKRFFILLVSILLVLSAFKPKASAVYNNSNSNRKKPKDQKIQVFKITEEDFLIEPEGTDVKALFRVYHFDFDPDGNIFVLDAGNYRILKFSAAGEFIRSFSRKGRGPGELNHPDCLAVSPDGQVYVAEGSRMTVFSNTGKYIKDFDLLSHYMQKMITFVFSGKDSIVSEIYDPAEIEWKGYKHATTKTYVAGFDLHNKSRTIYGDVIKNKTGKIGKYYIYPVVNSNRSVFYATIDEKQYRVFMYAPDGTLIKKITKKFEPVLISKKEREKMREMRERMIKSGKGKLLGEDFFTPIPKYYPVIKFLIVDTSDYLWVFTNESKNEQLFSVDLYNEKGDYLKTFFLSNELLFKYGRLETMKIWNQYLFSIVNHPELGEVLMRFELPKETWE